MTHVRSARGFAELVIDHLKFVVASDSPLQTASPAARALYFNFGVADRRNTYYIACQMVWAATYIRHLRNQRWWRRSKHVAEARAVARRAQLEFVSHCPDAEYWRRILGSSDA